MQISGFGPKQLLAKKPLIGLIICIAPLLALVDFLLFRQAFFNFDFEVQWIPFHYFMHSALMRGESMLWNPYIMLGFPQHGESQAGVFYPLNLILNWLPSQTYAVALSLYLHLVIAMTATYGLARSCRLGVLASLHAAVCFGLSGYIFAQFTNYNIVLVSVYLPLKLLLINRYFDRGSAVYLLYFALASAAELLVSHPHMSFNTSVAAGLYFVILAVMKSRSVSLARDFGLYAACSVLAVALAAVQIVPTFEFFTLTERSGGLSYEAMTGYSHGFAYYLTAFFPMMYGAPSIGYTGGPFEETYFYAGSFGILLALFGALMFLRRRDSRFFTAIGILGLVGLLLSLGYNTPFFDIYRWLVHVPGFNLFRCPGRWSLVVTLAAAIFSGYGLQALIGYMQSRKPVLPVLTIVAIALIAPFLVYVLAGNDQGVYTLAILESILHPLAADLGWLYSPVDRWLYAIFTRISPLTYFLSVVVVLLLVILSAYRLPARHCAAIIVVLGFLDMLLVIKPMNPARSPDLYAGTPSHIEYVQQNVGVQRAVSTDGVPTPISLNGSAASVYRVQTLGGWSALRLNSYVWLSYHLTGPDIQDYLGVKYEIRPVDGSDAYAVHERPGAFPRAFLLEHHWVEHDAEAAFEAFISMDEAARRTSAVILPEAANVLGIEPNPPLPGHSAAAIRPANILRYQHGRIEIEGETQTPSFLLLTDMHYPGWRARLNGAEVPVVPLNGVFRGVYIEKPGSFRLEFDYSPLSFKVGAWLSLAALLLSALLWRAAVRRAGAVSGQTKLPRLRLPIQRMLGRAGSARARLRS